LGNYGGTTQTMLPRPSSPAICVGSFAQFPSGVTTDQRGFPLTACVDAGAVQTNYLMVNTTADRSDASCGANCSLRDAIQQVRVRARETLPSPPAPPEPSPSAARSLH
jgi:CSLREA domain-containing protein